MLVDFQDHMNRRGSIPYDDIGSIREDNSGFGILRSKNGEVILTNMSYKGLVQAYKAAVEEDIVIMMGLEDLEDDEDE